MNHSKEDRNLYSKFTENEPEEMLASKYLNIGDEILDDYETY